MTEARKQFYNNVDSLMVLDSIYQYLAKQVTAFDITEILRAQYILTVSAMDYYIHEVVREGFFKSLNDQDAKSKLDKVSISLHVVKALLNIDNHEERRKVLDASIREVLTKDSYQSPRNVENALGLIGYRNLWHKICNGTDKEPGDVKRQLSLIILRRNKIAHEADMNFTTQEKESIDRTTTKSCLDYISWLVDRIDLLIET